MTLSRRVKAGVFTLFGVICGSSAVATMPSVPFGDMARNATCIALAKPLGPGAENEYRFRPLAIVATTQCPSGTITVRRNTSESLKEFSSVPYLLFLRAAEGDVFRYADEPFSALSVSEGKVSMFAFIELPKSMALDQVLEVIQRERSARPQ